MRQSEFGILGATAQAVHVHMRCRTAVAGKHLRCLPSWVSSSGFVSCWPLNVRNLLQFFKRLFVDESPMSSYVPMCHPSERISCSMTWRAPPSDTLPQFVSLTNHNYTLPYTTKMYKHWVKMPKKYLDHPNNSPVEVHHSLTPDPPLTWAERNGVLAFSENMLPIPWFNHVKS